MTFNINRDIASTSISIHEHGACVFCRCVLFFRYH